MKTHLVFLTAWYECGGGGGEYVCIGVEAGEGVATKVLRESCEGQTEDGSKDRQKSKRTI